MRVLCAVALLVAPFAFAQSDGGTADGGLSPEDEKLLKEIEAATAGPPPGQTAPPPPAPATAQPSAANRALNLFSNLFNPAMSANGLLLARVSSEPTAPGELPVGLALQELELQFLANVDPYFTANLILAIPNMEGLEVEEGYVAAIPQPLGISLRAGKMRQAFGRDNPLHTHALPFVERTLVNTDVFGEEGMSEVAVEASWLAPLPWYALLTAAGMDGANEKLFGSKEAKDFAGFFALKNVFDLTDDATLEAGVHYTLGNNIDRKLAQALGAHVTFKWKPAADARNHSLVIELEGMLARRPAGADNLEAPPYETAGFSGFLQVQLWRGWYIAGRFDLLGHQGPPESLSGLPVETDITMRQSAVLVFAPTEFSAFRAQVSVTEPPGLAAGLVEPIVTGMLQVNFTIGAHPAHGY